MRSCAAHAPQVDFAPIGGLRRPSRGAAPFCAAFTRSAVETRLPGWGGKDSNFGIRRRSAGANQTLNPGMLRQQKPDIPCRNDWTSAANRASVSSCDAGLLASSRIPPRWRYRPLWGFGGDGACAVTIEKDLKDVASQHTQQAEGRASQARE